MVVIAVGLVACSKSRTGTVPPATPSSARAAADQGITPGSRERAPFGNEKSSSIWDAFGPDRNDQTVLVNRFIWNAALDVLNFLPVEQVDPFTGIIVTGYGTPPGGGRSYRATVFITDPALEARSLRVSLQGSGGRPVNPSTTRAVEDAILARARQMRISDNKL
jgi:hypothetical protein